MEDPVEKIGPALKNPENTGNKVIGVLNTIDSEGIPVRVVTSKDPFKGIQEQKVYTSEDKLKVMKTAASRIIR